MLSSKLSCFLPEDKSSSLNMVYRILSYLIPVDLFSSSTTACLHPLLCTPFTCRLYHTTSFKLEIFFFFFFNIYLYIWLCQVLVAAVGIFDLCCGMWDLFSCGVQTP